MTEIHRGGEEDENLTPYNHFEDSHEPEAYEADPIPYTPESNELSPEDFRQRLGQLVEHYESELSDPLLALGINPREEVSIPNNGMHTMVHFLAIIHTQRLYDAAQQLLQSDQRTEELLQTIQTNIHPPKPDQIYRQVQIARNLKLVNDAIQEEHFFETIPEAISQIESRQEIGSDFFEKQLKSHRELYKIQLEPIFEKLKVNPETSIPLQSSAVPLIDFVAHVYIEKIKKIAVSLLGSPKKTQELLDKIKNTQNTPKTQRTERRISLALNLPVVLTMIAEYDFFNATKEIIEVDEFEGSSNEDLPKQS